MNHRLIIKKDLMKKQSIYKKKNDDKHPFDFTISHKNYPICIN